MARGAKGAHTLKIPKNHQHLNAIKALAKMPVGPGIREVHNEMPENPDNPIPDVYKPAPRRPRAAY